MEGADIFLEDFIQQEIDEAGDYSAIQGFYNGLTVFVTSGTGFIGQTLIEKLLRSTNDSRIYVLIRSKGIKSSQQRLDECLQDVLFTTATNIRGDLRAIVKPIPGNCGFPGLGITESDYKRLVDEVEIIIHNASTPHELDNLKISFHVNVAATRFLLDMAEKMSRLLAFIYVSSTYSNGNLLVVDDKIYEAPISHYKLESLIDILDEESLDLLRPRLYGKWPNVQTFTKLITENLIEENNRGLPLGIIRPSIVVSTAFEPLVGWVNNSQGLQKIAFSCLSGIMRVFHAQPRFKADLVPVDLTVNAILAFTYDVANTNGNVANLEDLQKRTELEVPVMNFVSRRSNPITWGSFMQLCLIYGMAIPKLSDVSIPQFTIETNTFIVLIHQWLYHYVPSLLSDTVLYIRGQHPKWIYLYQKLHVYSNMFSKFTTKQYQFSDRYASDLWNRLGPGDRALFNFNLASVNWNEYTKMYIRGLRTYIAKESIDTLPEAQIHQDRLWLSYYFGRFLVLAVIVYMLLKNTFIYEIVIGNFSNLYEV